MQYLPILVLALITVLVCSYFISKAAYKELKKAGSKYALIPAILVYLASALILYFVCVKLIVNNIRIER